jgi:hypothetical protein
MPWMIPAAIIGGSVISSLAGGDAADTQAQATRDASSTTADATNRATAEQQRQFDLTRSDLAPYRAAGTTALGQLGTGVGDDGTSGPLTRKFSVADFWNDPVVKLGYQSGLDLGTKALRNRAPLTTGLDSGAGLKELTQFGTDYTGMKAGDSYGRFVGDQGNQFGRLAALAGIGQTATNTGATVGANISGNIAGTTMAGGTNIANLISAGGNAAAASRIAQGNAFGGGLNSVANWWQSQNMLNRMYPAGGSATPMFSYTGYDSAGGPAYG